MILVGRIRLFSLGSRNKEIWGGVGWGGWEEREVGVCDLMVKDENIQIQSSLLTITLFPLPVVKFNLKKKKNI